VLTATSTLGEAVPMAQRGVVAEFRDWLLTLNTSMDGFYVATGTGDAPEINKGLSTALWPDAKMQPLQMAWDALASYVSTDSSPYPFPIGTGSTVAAVRQLTSKLLHDFDLRVIGSLLPAAKQDLVPVTPNTPVWWVPKAPQAPVPWYAVALSSTAAIAGGVLVGLWITSSRGR